MHLSFTRCRSVLLAILLVADLGLAETRFVDDGDKPRQILKGMGVTLPSAFRDDGRGKEQLFLDHLIVQCMDLDYTIERTLYGRHMIDFARSDFDFVTTVPSGTEIRGRFESRPYISYTNGVITLAGARIDSLDDLHGKRVVSFDGASAVLPGLAEARGNFALYLEKAKQELHTKMLLANRVDAVISDPIIFYAHTRELVSAGAIDARNLEFHHILEELHFSAYFKDESLRDAFDACVAEMFESGAQERLRYEFYINELYRSLG